MMGHFYPRQTILVPAGLITEPNEYGQYPPGALQVTRNVTMREPGKVDQAPNVRNTVAVSAADAVLHKLMPADSGIVYAIVRQPVLGDPDAWRIYADGVLETFMTFTGLVTTQSRDAFSATGRINWAQCNGRLIVNAKYSQLVRDPVPLSAHFRAAGLPQLSIGGTALTASAGWLEPGHAVQYRLCLARRYAEDYTLRSTPSVPARVNGQANPFNVLVTAEWPTFAAGIEPGDVMELYRTDILATTSLYADTGATYKLVQEHILTSAEIAAGSFVFTDTQPPILGTLKTQGRELYTNPGVEGETYANLRPPMSECIASFKGFCFYGNTTERAQLKFGVPGGWGWTEFGSDAGIPDATARAKGVGKRTGAGAITSGSAVITGVSAADIVGVAVGQRWFGGNGFNAGDSVTAVGASTITMSVPATMNGTVWDLYDVIEINGAVYSMERPGKLLDTLNGQMEVQFDQADAAIGVYQTSFEMKLMYNTPPFNRPILVRASNGQNYSPPLPTMVGGSLAKQIDPLVRKNRVVWSKEQQPEHAPSVSETFVGFGEIYAMNATRDSIFIWCSDGLHRLGGNGGSLGLGAWQVDYSNSTLLLCAPQASTVLDELVYGYTNDGVVEVDSATNLRNLSVGVIGDIMPGPRYREVMGIIMERNETDGEVLLTLGEDENGFSDRVYVYNVRQKAWTYLEGDAEGNGLDLDNITAMAMFRLPPANAEPHVLLASYQGSLPPVYASWDAPDDFCDSSVQYQPLYGDNPLELKRWMWADYLFDKNSSDPIDVIWNDLEFSGIPVRQLDIGMYARAGCPREVGVSHSLSPGFRWRSSSTQNRFEGISLAIKQRTNQPKERGA